MPGGRPLKFSTKEELQAKIEAYFDSCWKESEGIMKQIKPYTISGLAVFLDTSRETLLNYEEREEFFDTIKGAKDKCEAFVEEQLFLGKNAVGPIFNLKNNYAQWKEKQETDITTKGESLNKGAMSPEKIAEIDKIALDEQ